MTEENKRIIRKNEEKTCKTQEFFLNFIPKSISGKPLFLPHDDDDDESRQQWDGEDKIITSDDERKMSL